MSNQEKDTKKFSGLERNGMGDVAISIKEAGENVKAGVTHLGNSLEKGMRGFGSEGKTFQITDKGIATSVDIVVEGIATAVDIGVEGIATSVDIVVKGIAISVGIGVIGGIVTYFVMKKWYEKKESCE